MRTTGVKNWVLDACRTVPTLRSWTWVLVAILAASASAALLAIYRERLPYVLSLIPSSPLAYSYLVLMTALVIVLQRPDVPEFRGFIDTVTGIAERPYFMLRLSEEVARSRR